MPRACASLLRVCLYASYGACGCVLRFTADQSPGMSRQRVRQSSSFVSSEPQRDKQACSSAAASAAVHMR
eukprot:20183-Heterococcus_DN1.PRE.1